MTPLTPHLPYASTPSFTADSLQTWLTFQFQELHRKIDTLAAMQRQMRDLMKKKSKKVISLHTQLAWILTTVHLSRQCESGIIDMEEVRCSGKKNVM